MSYHQVEVNLDMKITRWRKMKSLHISSKGIVHPEMKSLSSLILMLKLLQTCKDFILLLNTK